MLKKMLYNKKGSAEVIGSVMFIVILMFFFTNVYLWHDAAVKEMNDLQVQRVNSEIDLSYDPATRVLTVTAKRIDIELSRIWIVEQKPSPLHLFADLLNSDNTNVHVKAGRSITISFASSTSYVDEYQLSTNSFSGGNVQVSYALQSGVPITCTLLNTVGVAVTAYCTP